MRPVEETARPEPAGDPFEMLDSKGVAEMLGCCVKTVYAMFKSGRLSYALVGRSYRTTRGAVMRDLGLE